MKKSLINTRSGVRATNLFYIINLNESEVSINLMKNKDISCVEILK